MLSLLLQLSLALVIVSPVQSALAFGGKSSYSDPSSSLGAFFVDESREDRDTMDDWATSDELRTQWLRFQTEIRSPDFAPCESWKTCPARREVPRWIDWDLWMQLNLEAADLWADLVACAPNQNPEAARIAYYRAKSYCHRDSAASERLASRLQLLHGRIRDFVNSTTVAWPDKYQDESTITALNRIVPFHPLFVQVVLEYASTIVRFYTPDGRFRGDPAYDSSWIDGNYNRSFGDRVEAILEGRPDAVSERYQQARAYLNLHLLLGFLPKPATLNKLPSWGLWRASSWMLNAIMSRQSFVSHGRIRDRSVFYLSYALTSSIGWYGRFEPTLPAAISQDRGGVVAEFRAMAERYGFPTDRRKFCSTKPLVYNICFAIDPSNPDETMEQY